MLDWNALQQEYDQLVKKLADPSLDSKTRGPLQKRSSQISQILVIHRQIDELTKNIEEAVAQRDKENEDLRELYDEEIQTFEAKREEVKQQFDELLYPPDPQDNRSVFLEIRAGAGGQEAALFALDLFKMYSNFALVQGWQVSIVDENITDLGGYKELVIYIKGRKVYRFLRFESGVHRVQRVPKTDTAGRIHTSTVTVAVLPEVKDVEVNINTGDLRIDTYRASGAGGQHVNRTDSAVRITHIPTGIVVACQDERSQLKNKQRAMKVLKARVFAAEKAKEEAKVTAVRKQQIGTGQRAEKIRTYNFPQNRVTDHRTDLTLKKLDIVLQGNLLDLINPLLKWHGDQRRAESLLAKGLLAKGLLLDKKD